MDYQTRFDTTSYGDDVIAELAARTTLTAPAKRPLGMAGVRSELVRRETGTWLVCRAPQDPSCARLLDVAVALREQEGTPCLAILEPPADKKRKLAQTPGYLSAYQGIAWHALGVAFVLDDGPLHFSPANVTPRKEVGEAFEQLVGEIEAALIRDAKMMPGESSWILPEDSREAEALVRVTMNHVLHPRDYRRHVEAPTLAKTKAYAGFWRKGEADGLWTNRAAQVQHVALECKLDEDRDAPLCQIVDHLAWVISEGTGGVLGVRIHRREERNPKRKPNDAMYRLGQAVKQLEKAVLVRYLDIELGA
jgi:hypothetical protein